MGCCGHGKKRNSNMLNPITRPSVHSVGSINKNVKRKPSKVITSRRCPLCNTMMRYTQSYDKSERKIMKKYSCTNPACSNK